MLVGCCIFPRVFSLVTLLAVFCVAVCPSLALKYVCVFVGYYNAVIKQRACEQLKRSCLFNELVKIFRELREVSWTRANCVH